ncbi:MAG: DUF445 domain-containing protein [Ilumatobacter sp.]
MASTAVTEPPGSLTDDDQAKRRSLRRMQRVATSLFLAAAVVFVIAKANEDSATWIGYVRATAEAAMVGAIADWFAVTALFRHPLRIPIPHTAIIPKRKDEIGRSLGRFVESNFLTTEVIDQRLRSAAIGQRLGAWLADGRNAARVAAGSVDVARGALDVLDDDEIQQALGGLVRRRIDDTPVAPLVGRAVDVSIDGGHHQRLLDAVLVGLSRFMVDQRETFRQRLYAESPWWVPEGVDDRVYDKIHEVVNRFLLDVRADPHHEVRRGVDEQVTELARRLREDPDLRARGEQWKAELVDHPEVRTWIDSLWSEAKQTLLDAADDPNGELRERLTAGIVDLGRRLESDVELQRKLEDWAARALAHLVENHGSEVGDVIESTVARWDGESTAEKLELQVGRDLQFIRINGTLVGGLAGFVIHAFGQLL